MGYNNIDEALPIGTDNEDSREAGGCTYAGSTS